MNKIFKKMSNFTIFEEIFFLNLNLNFFTRKIQKISKSSPVHIKPTKKKMRARVREKFE